jgi:glutathione S-transferase
MNQAISILDSYAYRPMVWGVFVERVSKPLAGQSADERLVEQSMAASKVVLTALSDQLGDSPYLTGDTVSLADLHGYPMLRYFALTAEGAKALSVHRNLVTWMDSMQQRPSVQRTTSRFERAS